MSPEKKRKTAGEGDKRRVPTQARSLRRFESILSAAALAFADHGFEATTMDGIAARADTSIGSLYQFFPNKLAVFREVASRALVLTRQTFAEAMGPNPAQRPWRELVEIVVDAYRELQSNPVMRAVFSNIQLYGEYADEDAAQLREMTATVAALLSVWSPQLAPKTREVVGRLMVNTVATAMLLIANEPDTADELVVQTKLLLTRYLEPLVHNAE